MRPAARGRRTFDLRSGAIASIDNFRDGRTGSDEPCTPAGVALLVPGFTGSKEDFLPLLRPLATAGYHAVAIDQRGQYESAHAVDPQGYQLPALAADVAELADELGAAGPVHLVGHSFGGLVSRLAVIEHRELFADLVLMSSGPAGIRGQRRVLLDEGDEVLRTGGLSALWQQQRARAQADPRYMRLAPVLDAFLRERFMATDPVSLQIMGRTLRDEPDRTSELAGTGLPVLVVHGVDDDAWPPAVQAQMAVGLAASYRVIERAAHSPAVENPPATAAALIEFWQTRQG